MALRRYTRAAVVGCGLLLAACTATPVYPLMTPIQVAKNFGYFDQPVDETHAIVSYATPEQTGYGFRYDQSPAEAQAKTFALDLALFHAAQVTQAHGYPAFSVTDRHTDVDSVNVSGYWDGPYGQDGWAWGFRRRHFWGGWGGWGPNWEPPQNTLQVQAKLTIAFTRTPKPDDYRVEDTLARLRAAYPNAEALPVPPGAAPAPPPPAKPTA